jgi:hypothetical protein
VPSVVLCPPLPQTTAPLDEHAVADALLGHPRRRGAVISPQVPRADPDDDERTRRAHWVAHLAVALATAAVEPPLLLVLAGDSGALAPALGFSQRAARRDVVGYVLVDAALPSLETPGVDWPDAPVTYVASPHAPEGGAAQARLRGWDVVTVDDLAPATLADTLVGLAAP